MTHFRLLCSSSFIRTCGVTALLLTAAADPRAQQAPEVQKVPLTAGRSTVLSTDFDITRIAVTDPAVADAVVVQPREVLIDGGSPAPASFGASLISLSGSFSTTGATRPRFTTSSTFENPP